MTKEELGLLVKLVKVTKEVEKPTIDLSALIKKLEATEGN